MQWQCRGADDRERFCDAPYEVGGQPMAGYKPAMREGILRDAESVLPVDRANERGNSGEAEGLLFAFSCREPCPGHAGALRFVPRRAGALRVTDVGTGGGGDISVGVSGGRPSEVLYGPWDIKTVVGPKGPGQGFR